jgi:hypothetical protein
MTSVIQSNRKKVAIILYSLAFILRLFLNFSYDTGDSGAVNQATGLFLENREVYGNQQVHFSPPPFALHILSFLHFISNVLKIPFISFWKILASIADIGVAILIYRLSISVFKRTRFKSKQLSLFYLFNPIALFISGYHGQQESVWLFLVLLSFYLIKVNKKYHFSAIAAATALAYKLPALLLIPPLLILLPSKKRQVVFTVEILLVFILSLLPELITSQKGLITQVFLYGSTQGIWGIPLIAQLFQIRDIKIISLLLMLIIYSFIIAIWLLTYVLKNKNYLSVSLTILSIFFVFTPGFANQYLLWPLPFLILLHSRFVKWYTIFVTFAFLHTYSLGIWPLDQILSYFAQNVYLKITNYYPYILFIPVWIIFIKLLNQKPDAYEEVK